MINWQETVFCAVDTETTGVNPEGGDRIVEIALVPIFRGRIIRERAFISLVNPRVRIPALVEKVHGISNSLVMDAPSMDEVYPRIRDYLRGMVPVFHNGKFDLTFLDYAAKDVGQFPMDLVYIDTQDLSREVFGEVKSLEWMARYFSIAEKISHRALDDALVTAKVFLKLSRRIGEENLGKFTKHWRGKSI